MFAFTAFAMPPVTTCRRRYHHALYLALCISSVVDSLLIATSLRPQPAAGRGGARHDLVCATCSHGHVAPRRARCGKIGRGITMPSILIHHCCSPYPLRPPLLRRDTRAHVHVLRILRSCFYCTCIPYIGDHGVKHPHSPLRSRCSILISL